MFLFSMARRPPSSPRTSTLVPYTPLFRSCDAALLRETLQVAGRPAAGIERDVDVRPRHFGALLGLLDGDARQQHREATRRVQRLGFIAFESDAAPGQSADHAVEQGLRQAGQSADGECFGADIAPP